MAIPAGMQERFQSSLGDDRTMKYANATRGTLIAALGLLVTGFPAAADARPRIETDSSSSVVQDGAGIASAGQIAGSIANHLTGGTGGTGTQTSAAEATGVAAGDGAAPAGTLWFNAGAMRVDDSHTGANYDGDIYNAVLGYDVALTDKLTVGLAGAYERIRIDTKYNCGTLKGNVWSIAPYLSYRIDDMLSFNATVGHSWADYD
ncbi:MAG: autotransporter outer membrane beta-barrel domain-containing protein, partial [Nitratireductor sp.]